MESTFSIILQQWSSLNSQMQQKAQDMLNHAFQNHGRMIRDMVDVLPSLASIPLMTKFEECLVELRDKADVRKRFVAFARRCDHENPIVVSQAMEELRDYLITHQVYIHASAISAQVDPIVGELLRSVLDASVKFSDGQPSISRLSAECIGLIGCLDANRVESNRARREIVVSSNFEDREDTLDFIFFFLEEVLVKCFLSATSTRSQGFLAWSMQALLQGCDIDVAISQKGELLDGNSIYRRWIALSDPVRSTLAPFLKSSYLLSKRPDWTTAEYPIFKTGMTHKVWIKNLVRDLLQKAAPGNMTLIATICVRIVGVDTAVAIFLAPFIALNVVVTGTEEHRQGFKQELLAILGCQIDNGSHADWEALKLCSDVSAKS
jgi:serine/threonine-protein kinase ATR